ncbi:hypothetical protein C8R48DRAFT_776428 [Suillus tomentosus]|nr:hypothetical protein C8R48DRAFT_776428 [Suillus tomentosus]
MSPPLRVHMYDRLWASHGLVRYGVAPDHPEVKNCANKFDATATDPRFRFFGNVNVGSMPLNSIPYALRLPLTSILNNYSHLLFAIGLYYAHLDPAIPPSPPPPALDKITHLTLIGQGNVSLDIARILLTSPSVLRQYDVPEHVLEVLSRSTVKHVSIVGRRGPLEAAFTTKELREMINLPEASYRTHFTYTPIRCRINTPAAAHARATPEGIQESIRIDAQIQCFSVRIKDGMVIQYDDWKVIENEEVRRGGALGKEREKWAGTRPCRSSLSRARGRDTLIVSAVPMQVGT